jgi:hypothetical protein
VKLSSGGPAAGLQGTDANGGSIVSAVFITYRAADSQVYGALLYEALSRRPDEHDVFLDGESIPAGKNFAAAGARRMASR